MDKKAIKTSGKILLSFCKGSTSMNLANVFVKSFFIDFPIFFWKKGALNSTHSSCGFLKKLYNRVSGYCCLSVSIALA